MTLPVHPASLDGEALLSGCEFSQGRSGGPGGQHRNKVETKVMLRHRDTGLSAQAGERRSVAENKRVAIFRLRLALATLHRCGVPIGEIGSALWRSRRRPSDSGGSIACNPEHHDYPTLLAEALDVVHACGYDTRKAALRLSVSASQLVKLIKDHPPALAMVNRERTARGEHPLK
ncbi:MAG: peptide chain release factor-like protein [Phycisphaerales bacterium]|nr:peptide chain release factor-like protein [Phycisphaerales bacterium]